MRASSGCFAVLAVTLVGCSADLETGKSSDRVGRAIQPIIGGVSSSAEHDAVVVLAQFSGGVRQELCSATLVAPNLLLTARHCVSSADSSVSCNTDGTAAVGAVIHGDVPVANLVVFAPKDGKVPSLNDETLASAHATKLVVDDSSTLCNHDLAFVLLDRPVDAPIATLRLSGGPTFDERVTIVGWGIDESGALPGIRRERSDIPLLGTGPVLFPDDKRYGIGNAEVMFPESACLGDSGGPAFTRAGVLVGVASRVGNGKPRDPANLSSTCTGDTAHAVYTHLGRHADLVKRAFAEASNVPVVEPPPLAVTSPKVGDPKSSTIGADLQDPDRGPMLDSPDEKRVLSARADTSSADADGGCSMTRPSARGDAAAAGILAMLGLFVYGRRVRSGSRSR